MTGVVSRRPASLARLAATVAAGAVALAVVTWQLAGATRGDRVPVPAGSTTAAHGEDATAPVHLAPAPAAPPAGAGRSLAQVEKALFVDGSLRGTDHPDWGTARGEPVRPNRALRDRFDHYLLAMSEASIAELTALLKAHAERDLGAAAAGDIVALWDRYLHLQRHAFRQVANPADPASMQAALQEHQQVRQSILGLHWAQAFYGDDERALADTLTQARTGDPRPRDADHALLSPPAGTDPQALHQQRIERYGTEAAQRLQAVDAEDARWTRRLARTQAEVDAIRNDPGRSDVQRADALARLLDGAYPDASERLRAQGLLGL